MVLGWRWDCLRNDLSPANQFQQNVWHLFVFDLTQRRRRLILVSTLDWSIQIANPITVPIYKKRVHVGTWLVSDRWEAFQVTMVTQSEAWSQIGMKSPKYLHVIFMSKHTLVSHFHNNTVVLGQNGNCSFERTKEAPLPIEGRLKDLNETDSRETRKGGKVVVIRFQSYSFQYNPFTVHKSC